MRFIILAAGKGSRLRDSLPNGYPYETKSLMKINGEPFINDLIEKISDLTKNKITVVLGHKFEEVYKVLPSQKVSTIFNKWYDKDSNLNSVYLAIESILKENNGIINKGVIIIEADSYFSKNDFKSFVSFLNKLDIKEKNSKKICWTSKGLAKSNDSGGFLDIKIKKNKYGEVYKAYISTKKNKLQTMKMFGITWLSEQSTYLWYRNAKLFIANKEYKKNKHYFHKIIFENDKEFKMLYYDFGENALSFNTYEEYLFCIQKNKRKNHKK